MEVQVAGGLGGLGGLGEAGAQGCFDFFANRPALSVVQPLIGLSAWQAERPASRPRTVSLPARQDGPSAKPVADFLPTHARTHTCMHARSRRQ